MDHLKTEVQPRVSLVYEGGVRGGLKTAKPHRNTLKNRKPHRIFPEYRNRTYMEAHYMKADMTGLRNSNLRVIATKEVLLKLVHL